MQTLQVKQPDKTTKTVHVHRSWQDINGKHIFLHHNGVYGFKDGSPIKSPADLEVLPPEHRRLAMAWWSRVGSEMSAQFYSGKEEEAARNAGDYQEQLAAEEFNTKLDSVLYSRRPIVNGKAKGAVSAPKPWMEFGFTRRPDWWGQAKAIAFPDYAYSMLDPEEKEEAPGPDKEKEESPGPETSKSDPDKEKKESPGPKTSESDPDKEKKESPGPKTSKSDPDIKGTDSGAPGSGIYSPGTDEF
jgi:hypothetical protein